MLVRVQGQHFLRMRVRVQQNRASPPSPSSSSSPHPWHYHNLTIIGDEKQIKYLIENFTNVIEIIHGLDASVKQEEKLKKKKLALAKTETLESVKLEKFSGQGDNKYLHYYIWYTEFWELVMKKEYSDSVKLKYLKQYTERKLMILSKTTITLKSF